VFNRGSLKLTLEKSPIKLVNYETISCNSKLSDETNLEESIEDIDVQSVYNEELDTFIQDLEVQDFSKALEDARSEVIQINASHIRNMRDAGGVTAPMVTEVQELLSLFGIPYVVAPMEAESQCAYFQIHKMIDGIITDDSDVFLFGGDVVYKNMFDNKKFVQRYTMSEMNDEMGLTRIELIQMAYLLGSDYTIGVKGIGPVSSIEIVTTWQSETLAGLSLFKDWVADLQKGIVGDIEGRELNGLIAACKKIKFQENFPDPRIMNAYLDPVVDESKEIFTWGKPQLEQLTLYLKNKLGWEKEKINDIIVPVMKGMQDKRQTTIESFFPFLPKKSKSKRVLNATRGGRKRQRSGD
jgi:DNA excision repair protein ERCC-5